MNYKLNGEVALITMDAGKVNALGNQVFDFLANSLDRAEKEAKAVVLQGREGMFTAGFDLNELVNAKTKTVDLPLVARGMELLYRLFSFPLPVVSSCSGHSFGMGGFILLVSDTRLGAEGDYTICLPETRISMIFNPMLVDLAGYRLSKRHLTRAVLQSHRYGPAEAVSAGFLDQLVPAGQLSALAMAEAGQLAQLPAEFYLKNKLHLRQATLESMRNALADLHKGAASTG